MFVWFEDLSKSCWERVEIYPEDAESYVIIGKEVKFGVNNWNSGDGVQATYKLKIPPIPYNNPLEISFTLSVDADGYVILPGSPILEFIANHYQGLNLFCFIDHYPVHYANTVNVKIIIDEDNLLSAFLDSYTIIDKIDNYWGCDFKVIVYASPYGNDRINTGSLILNDLTILSAVEKPKEPEPTIYNCNNAKLVFDVINNRISKLGGIL